MRVIDEIFLALENFRIWSSYLMACYGDIKEGWDYSLVTMSTKKNSSDKIDNHDENHFEVEKIYILSF